MARMHYRAGRFGEFRLAQASMVEPWYYRDSNFQNWCTTENTDLFSYVGCHYVDQVHFITGLLPVEVSVYGIIDTYPNGNKGYLWTDARVIWDNGACLNVVDAIGYPNAAPGGNMQGIRMLSQGGKDGCFMYHDDQFRGLRYCMDPEVEGVDKTYTEPSPDFMQLLYRGGEGRQAVGYGYRSIEGIINAAQRVVDVGDELEKRQEILEVIDDEGIVATPSNSSYNELVVEAARMSVAANGRPVQIFYAEEPGEQGYVVFKDEA